MLTAPGRDTWTWQVRRWRAMGSSAQLVVGSTDAARAAHDAVRRIAELERRWSRFDAGSELRAVNRSAGSPVSVSPDLWLALTAARDAWQRTGGAFDPTVLTRLCALGYDRTFRAIAADEPGAAPPAGTVPGFEVVELDDADRSVRLRAGVGLDLGGIGKGLAADLVSAMLHERGCSVALSLGGDVAVRGPGGGDGGSWDVPVLDVASGRLLGRFPLVDEGIVQSTTALRRWRRGGVDLHHLIDPRSGWPAAAGIDHAVVTGPSAATAEALAKAAVVVGAADGLRLVADNGYDGWLFASDGSVHATEGVRGDLAGRDAG